jgi:alkylation response protein AidB-like acyl-CoA dehydrogenase
VDFDDTDQERAYRAEARAWLEANARPIEPGASRRAMELSEEHIEGAKQWQRTLADGGWAGITWPVEHGGRGEGATQQAIFDQEQAEFDVHHGPLMVGLSMVGPTLIAHGTPEQQRRFLGPMLRGEEVWCQLFSEPEAGSDLASLRTVAVRDGDDFVVDGQKVWTSGAQFSDWGILLARTDPDAPKHRGISYLLVDMRSPGIEVRPLRQITGIAHFNEVFLTGVRVPVANLVGELHGGWGVTRTTLGSERSAIGGGRTGASWEDLVELARANGRSADPVVRQRLARAYTTNQVLRYLGLRAETAQRLGQVPAAEGSVMKLIVSRQAADNGDLLCELAGPAGALESERAASFLNQWSVRIGGGTDQIQRNVLGERVLGLPRDPRP